MKLLKTLRKYIFKEPKELEETGLPPYANHDDLIRCTEIVRTELGNRDIIVDEDVLKKITVDIMNISDAKGGGYFSDVIRSFAIRYIVWEFYKKFLPNENEQERKGNYCFEEIKEEVLKWYQSRIANGAEYMRLIRDDDTEVVIKLLLYDRRAYITVSDTTVRSCNMVTFEASAFNPYKNESELIYYFYDSGDKTIEDIMNGLNAGVEYCLNFKGFDS